jgi:formylglycine-generating enzyme required for sulfatase activity
VLPAVLALAACGADAPSAPKTPVAPPDLVVELDGGVKMDFVLVRPGSFRMGTVDMYGKQQPPYRHVSVSNEFYMARYEVTQEQWQALMGTNPSHFKGPKRPVESVGWTDCQAFLEKLNERVPGQKFVLPTEAQWEYACRAGTTTTWCCGDDPGQVGDYAWYGGNAGDTTHPVGEKLPNAWGFYDMHGNVLEMCADSSQQDGGPPPMSTREGPGEVSTVGPARGLSHVVRGGAFFYSALQVSSAARGEYRSDPFLSLGFRPATSAETTPTSAARQAAGVAAKPKRVVPQSSLAPAEAEAAAMAILETYRDETSAHYPDPREARLVAIGRSAAGVLIKVLSDPAYKDLWAMRTAAMRALPSLALDEDAAMIARLMREGHRELEVAFASLYAPETIATYAGLLRDGCFDRGLHEAARPHLRDPAVIAACCAWLAGPKYDGDLNFAIAEMAELVGGTGPYRLSDDPRAEAARRLDLRQPLPDIMPEAGPALKALLTRPLRIDARRNVAAAMVRIGDKAGIPALIGVLASPVDSSDDPNGSYQREAAGKQLNTVSGTRIYAGRDAAAEAKQFAEWWAKSKDALRFDPATQQWSVK